MKAHYMMENEHVVGARRVRIQEIADGVARRTRVAVAAHARPRNSFRVLFECAYP